MAQGRDASRFKGQKVKRTTNSSNSIGVSRIATPDRRGHVKGKVPRTLATRLPKKWGQ